MTRHAAPGQCRPERAPGELDSVKGCHSEGAVSMLGHRILAYCPGRKVKRSRSSGAPGSRCQIRSHSGLYSSATGRRRCSTTTLPPALGTTCRAAGAHNERVMFAVCGGTPPVCLQSTAPAALGPPQP